MEEQVLSIEQMQELQELGIDISGASMCWLKDDIEQHVISVNSKDIIQSELTYYADFLPTFTLQDILKILPKCITKDTVKYQLKVITDIPAVMYNNMWEGGYGVKVENDITLIDAAFGVLKWWKTTGCEKYVEYEQEIKTET